MPYSLCISASLSFALALPAVTDPPKVSYQRSLVSVWDGLGCLAVYQVQLWRDGQDGLLNGQHRTGGDTEWKQLPSDRRTHHNLCKSPQASIDHGATPGCGREMHYRHCLQLQENEKAVCLPHRAKLVTTNVRGQSRIGMYEHILSNMRPRQANEHR